MKTADKMYVNGGFAALHGRETLTIHNPANNEPIGQVVLGDEADALTAVAAARQAFPAFARSTKEQRMDYLQRLHDALMERIDDLTEVTIAEYGATVQRSEWSNRYAAEAFLLFKELLRGYSFRKTIGASEVVLEPVGVTAIFTAWNANAGSICVKLAAAIAAGCTVVIKPSELSALQTQVLMECFAQADLPAGVINVLNGRGEVLGTALSLHADVARITFTGSTAVGKIIARNSVETMKRLTLELSGKSPNILLDDADLETAVPMAVQACFQNSGQACVAGSRLLVPARLLPDVKALIVRTVEAMPTGDPRDPQTAIGPMASARQYERIQHYIQAGIAEGAELLTGGPGKPSGLEAGHFVKPTVFTGVTNDMIIAREEIFGPVLSVIAYETEEEAIAIADDTVYGLQAYLSSSDAERANRVAAQLQAGRVMINTLKHDPLAPFGGFKQSGLGREGGIYGLEQQLEPKAIIR